MKRRLLFTGLGAAVLLLSSTGCVDPEGSFDDFAERKQRTGGTGGSGGKADSGPCNIPSAGQADGPVLLVVSVATLDASKPVLLGGGITTTEPPREVHFNLSHSTPWTGKRRLAPLSSRRTPCSTTALCWRLSIARPSTVERMRSLITPRSTARSRSTVACATRAALELRTGHAGQLLLRHDAGHLSRRSIRRSTEPSP